MVFYEAPHRLRDCLDDLLQILGDREIVLAREMSKIYEEFLRGNLSGVKSDAESREPLRGEVVLVVKGFEEDRDRDRDREELLRGEIERLKSEGMHVKEIAALLGEKFSYPKREIYRLALEARGREKVIS
jgi:16S rRNA (cytidine1402-2'-O)-methyltransferase